MVGVCILSPAAVVVGVCILSPARQLWLVYVF